MQQFPFWLFKLIWLIIVGWSLALSTINRPIADVCLQALVYFKISFLTYFNNLRIALSGRGTGNSSCPRFKLIFMVLFKPMEKIIICRDSGGVHEAKLSGSKVCTTSACRWGATFLKVPFYWITLPHWPSLQFSWWAHETAVTVGAPRFWNSFPQRIPRVLSLVKLL